MKQHPVELSYLSCSPKGRAYSWSFTAGEYSDMKTMLHDDNRKQYKGPLVCTCIVVMIVLRWRLIPSKQSNHCIPGLPNSNPLHCKEKRRNNNISMVFRPIHCKWTTFCSYSQLSYCEHSIIMVTHYKNRTQPQPKLQRNVWKQLLPFQTLCHRIGETSGGPKNHFYCSSLVAKDNLQQIQWMT